MENESPSSERLIANLYKNPDNKLYLDKPAKLKEETEKLFAILAQKNEKRTTFSSQANRISFNYIPSKKAQGILECQRIKAPVLAKVDHNRFDVIACTLQPDNRKTLLRWKEAINIVEQFEY